MAAKPLSQRVKTDPALLQKALGNPGLRSQLPDKYLSPTQVQARRRHEFIDGLGDLTTPLSGEAMVNAGQQITDLKYKPQYDALQTNEDQAIANRDQQQRWAGDYSSQLNSILGGLVGAQGGANAGSAAAMQAQRDATMQAIDAGAAGEQQRQQQDAAVRGDLAGIGAAQAQDATAQVRDRAAANAQTAADEATATGGAQEAFLRGVQAVGGQRGQEYQDQIRTGAQNTLDDIAHKRQTLSQTEGDDLVNSILGLRSSEGDRYVTMQGLANDQQKAELDAKTNMAQIKSDAELQQAKNDLQVKLKQMGIDAASAKQTADQTFQAKQNELNRQNRVDVASVSHADGGTKLGAPAAQKSAQSGIESALSVAKSLKAMGRHTAAQVLVSGQAGRQQYDDKGKRKIDAQGNPVFSRDIKAQDPLWASVALDLVFDGHISANNIKRLHDRGVRVNTLGYPTA